MVSKKTYIFVVLALLNSCAPTITVNPPGTTPSPSVTPSLMPSVIINSATPMPTVTPTLPLVSVEPTVSSTPVASPSANLSTLSVAEVKKITDSSIVKANNTFGLKLFLDIVKDQKSSNLFISPASVALALQMTYNGANGLTKDEMSKTLELGNLSLGNLNGLNKLLIQKITTPADDIKLQVANSIWFDKNRFTFNEEYKNNLTDYYQAEAHDLDLSNKSLATKSINDWVSKNTNGKIEKIFDVIPDDVGYLINAIYFKADWTKKFDKTQNEFRDFTLNGGSKKNVEMMADFRSFKYFNKIGGNYNNQGESELGFQAAELSYGKEGKISLIMFLPDSLSSLEKFYSQLNEDNLEKWINQFYYNQGYISFPKFKIESNQELNSNLTNMGIKKAFQASEADFTKMGSAGGNIYISRVLHKTYIDVNEEGTEAAAVTAVETSVVSSAPTKRFVADRPFFYMIRDNDTKSILFMGAVNDPKY